LTIGGVPASVIGCVLKIGHSMAGVETANADMYRLYSGQLSIFYCWEHVETLLHGEGLTGNFLIDGIPEI